MQVNITNEKLKGEWKNFNKIYLFREVLKGALFLLWILAPRIKTKLAKLEVPALQGTRLLP
jgi:hypothetical protein